VVSTFSPSGHRLYVALRTGTIVMLDRFTHSKLGALELPKPVDRLRVDRSGRWLMAHATRGDSLWVIDLARWVVATTQVAPWDDDLPQVADGTTLLLRSHADLVGVDLVSTSTPQRSVLIGGGDDLYIMLPWIPRTTGTLSATAPLPRGGAPVDSVPVTKALPALPPAADSAKPPPAASPTGTIYLQVSSSQNKDWAAALARQLKDGGFPAQVLDPADADEGYRVVIGPYASRDDADAVGRRLGRSYFIVTPAAGDST
jgi:hypothetical protein